MRTCRLDTEHIRLLAIFIWHAEWKFESIAFSFVHTCLQCNCNVGKAITNSFDCSKINVQRALDIYYTHAQTDNAHNSIHYA